MGVTALRSEFRTPPAHDAHGGPHANEGALPRRAPRPRKLPSWLRSPSPTPVTPVAKAPPRSRTETPGASGPTQTPTPTPAPTAAPPVSRTSTPAAPARTPRARLLSSPARSEALTPSASHDASCEARVSPDEATGPGKRHRRPSTMYRPPEALTSDPKKVPSPPASTPTARPKAPARHKSPPARPMRRSEDRCASPAVPSIVSTHTPAPVERMPATFTRHGERIAPPPRRTAAEVARPVEMSGILSPKPVRTATGVWRPLPTLPLEEEEEEEDEEEGLEVVQRSADLARQAWSIAVLGAPPKASGVKSVVFATEPAALPYESDNEEDDFHKTMLHDPELDLLTHVPSPSQEMSDASDGMLADGHVTTPASCAKEGTPCPGDLRSTRSPSVRSPCGEPSSDAVFQHALPLPRTSEAHTHAGALTLSLPYDVYAVPNATPTPPAHDDALDAAGETPLTPVHTVTAQEMVDRAAREAPASPMHALTALLPGTLPSEEAPQAQMGSAPSSPFSPASPLFDASPSTSDSTPTEGALHLSMPLKNDDEDPYFSSPEEMMALTDLDRAWDAAHWNDAAGTPPVQPQPQAQPQAQPQPQPPLAHKRRRCAESSGAEARRVPRLRSRAS